ncbi:ATP-binding protein [Streptomyces olindensis]|uniref:ATP-binding protein n=1 Tax=Streptomyces olindensis TaxID=358823 RepID=UPI0036555D4A
MRGDRGAFPLAAHSRRSRRRPQACRANHARVANSPGCVEDALLIASELMTNAVVHALPPASLRLHWKGVQAARTLRIEVTDAGRAPLHQQVASPSPLAETGRGSVIIAALSSRSGITTRANEATRWAEIHTSAP